MRVFSTIKWIMPLLLLFAACEEKEYLYDDPTDIVLFNETNLLFPVLDNVENNEVEVTISSPVVSSADREYIIGILQTGADDEAIQDKHYTLPSNTVVIPAGERVGKFKVQGIPTYLLADTDLFANFTIVSATAGEVAGFNNVFTLYMYRVCPFSFQDMVGTYIIAQSAMIDAKDIEVKVVLGTGAGELILLQPYMEGYDLTVTVQQEVSGAYTVIMRDQKMLLGRLATVVVEMWGRGAGTWNTCTNEMKLVITPYAPGGSEYVPVTEYLKKVE